MLGLHLDLPTSVKTREGAAGMALSTQRHFLTKIVNKSGSSSSPFAQKFAVALTYDLERLKFSMRAQLPSFVLLQLWCCVFFFLLG